MKNTNLLITSSLSIAFVCLATMFLQFPIPLGYAHLGNAIILLTSVYFGKKVGLFAGGIGSALADLLTGYGVWIIPTLIIKSIMGYLIGSISDQDIKSKRTLLAVIVGIVEMIVGYTLAGIILYHSVPTGLAQIPGLSIEGVVGIILYYVLGFALEKVHFKKLVTRLS